ncbi:MAG: metal ABC transporter permease [Lawsonella clevelandensis]
MSRSTGWMSRTGELLDLIHSVKAEGVAVVVSTHDIVLAKETCEKVLLLANRQVGFGPKEEVLVPELVAEAYGGHLPGGVPRCYPHHSYPSGAGQQWIASSRRWCEALEHLRLALQGVPGLAAVTSAPYMFRPFIMLMFLGIAAGLVGVIVNLRCLEFNAEAMVHSVFPGIVAGALYRGIDNIVPGAAVVAVIVAVALTWLGHSRRHQRSRHRHRPHQLLRLRRGALPLQKGTCLASWRLSCSAASWRSPTPASVQSILVCLIALVAIGVSWRAQVFRAFDRDGAMASGMSATAVDFWPMPLLPRWWWHLTSAVGVLLVIGYLVVPGAAARLVTHRISTMVPVAILVGVAGGWFGMWLMTVDSPHPIPQAAVALSVLALFALLLPVGYVMRKRGAGA